MRLTIDDSAVGIKWNGVDRSHKNRNRSVCLRVCVYVWVCVDAFHLMDFNTKQFVRSCVRVYKLKICTFVCAIQPQNLQTI